MPVRRLPEKPSLNHLKYQAKDLLKALAAHDLAAAQLIREFHPRFRKASDADIFAAHFRLSDAQLTVAREAGFPSWLRLKRHIEKPALADRLDLPHHDRIEAADFRHAVELIDAGDATGLREHLRKHPHLTHQRVLFEGGNYFRNPSLLEFSAENPIRHGKLPENIVEIAKVILEAGIEQPVVNETLMLVATGSVSRECGVQIPLINLLCDHGAGPDSATHPAALNGELEALQALVSRGARVDLPIAATLDRIEDFGRLLPTADSETRHLALALASQYERIEMIRLLLEAGEDPNRFNPVGGHSHATPLHQAALRGNADLVRLLLKHGARPDIKDVLWHSTPAGWAQCGGHGELESYLREKEASER